MHLKINLLTQDEEARKQIIVSNLVEVSLTRRMALQAMRALLPADMVEREVAGGGTMTPPCTAVIPRDQPEIVTVDIVQVSLVMMTWSRSAASTARAQHPVQR